jgi:hypothetical protein
MGPDASEARSTAAGAVSGGRVAAWVVIPLLAAGCSTGAAADAVRAVSTTGPSGPGPSGAASPAAPASSAAASPAAAASPSASPSPAPGQPRYDATVARIDPALRRRLVGRNWHPGCPVPLADLRVVTVAYLGFDGAVHHGPLVVHASVARDVRWVFGRIFAAGLRIHRIALPARYRPRRPIDWRSTRNVTAAFNCRPATENPGSLSQHSYGWAIDINPLQNPYVRGDGTVLRRAAAPYRDRTRHRRGMIRADGAVVRAFAAIGWSWGGDWTSIKDYMHFSLTGR